MPFITRLRHKHPKKKAWRGDCTDISYWGTDMHRCPDVCKNDCYCMHMRKIFSGASLKILVVCSSSLFCKKRFDIASTVQWLCGINAYSYDTVLARPCPTFAKGTGVAYCRLLARASESWRCVVVTVVWFAIAARVPVRRKRIEECAAAVYHTIFARLAPECTVT